jgi:hypothetical protein
VYAEQQLRLASVAQLSGVLVLPDRLAVFKAARILGYGPLSLRAMRLWRQNGCRYRSGRRHNKMLYLNTIV